jgi:hypothetical protein
MEDQLIKAVDHLTLDEATQFFSEFYGGEHHIPGYKVKPFGYGFVVLHDQGDLATFDSYGLTKLVLMAHDKCIRASVSPHNSGKIKICIWKRQGREGNFSRRHPTIETAIQDWRNKV